MTVLYGSVETYENGWKFRGRFGPKGERASFSIEGGLDRPIEGVVVPHAELINPKIGPFAYEGHIGPRLFEIKTTTNDVVVFGKLGTPMAEVQVRGWIQVAPVLYE